MPTSDPLRWATAICRFAGLGRKNRRNRPLGVVIGFSPWKTFIRDWLPGYDIRRESNKLTRREFWLSTAPVLLSARPNVEVFAWGYKEPPFVTRFCRRHKITINRVEDGFIRSVQLGAAKAPPLSICIDRQGLYFDATQPSDLEDLLNSFDFDARPDLVERGRKGIEALLGSKLSKYNTGAFARAEDFYGPKRGRKRVLVLGQVEGDMSIIKGCAANLTNNDLVRIARQENPDAHIIYKPHPEVLHGVRKDPPQSDPREVMDVAQVLLQDISLADAFETVDHVYTITSLSGFEALIRGIPVTCLGAPFYSGWGLTDDRQLTGRRKRRLPIEQLFAGAYILYPRYFHPTRRERIEYEEALALLAEMKEASVGTGRQGARAEARALVSQMG